MRAIRTTILVLFSALLLGACGSTDEEGKIREVVHDYLVAIAEGDPEACDLLTENELARIELQFEAFEEAGDAEGLEPCEGPGDLLEDYARDLGEAASAIEDGGGDLIEDKEHARLFYSAGNSRPFFEIYLVKDRGKWKIDDFFGP